MLAYGNFRNVPDNDKFLIYNFCSLVDGYESLGLVPPNNLGAIDGYDFDVKYYNYIMGIDMNFARLMNAIIVPLSSGADIYLITEDRNDWAYNVTESLMKLIQQRYGIVGVEINDPIDFENAEDIGFDPNYGIYNLDQDVDRFTYYCNMMQIIAGKPSGDDYE
jgi:hypothetical protein